MKKRGYLLPENVTPTETRSFCITIPDDPQYIRNFWGHMSVLGQWFSWEHGIAGDTRAKSAAELWRALIYQSWLAAAAGCGGTMENVDVRQNPTTPCILEKRTGDEAWEQFADLSLCPPMIRQGAGGEIEYSYDGGATWETVPPTPPTPRDGDEMDNKCIASANAVNVIVALHAEVVARYEPAVPIIGIALGLAIAIVSLLGLFILAANIALIIGSILTYASALANNVFDDETKDLLRCIFFNNATDTDGIVTFNFSAVQSEVSTNNSLGNIWEVITLYLQVIGEDGLNIAGATTAIEDADCSNCDDVWCYEFDFSVDDGGWFALDNFGAGGDAVYTGARWEAKTIGGNEILSIGIDFVGQVTQIVMEYGGVVADGGFKGLHINGTVRTGLTTSPQAYDTGIAATSVWFSIHNQSTATKGFTTKITMRGTGENPFGLDNCV